MNVILPVAGLGLRMRPHTLHRPKALVHVAGDAVLGHVLDDLAGAVSADRWVFVVGHLGAQVEAWVRRRHGALDARFVVQPEPRGQADAIALARAHLAGPVLIVFAADTVFDIDLAGLAALPADADGAVHLMRVEDPGRFGVAVVGPDGAVTRFVEKPTAPVSDLAVVGVYHVRDGAWLARAIDRLVAERPPTAGEHFLADALQVMVDEGARLVARPVRAWVDCGTVPATLAAQRYLFERRARAAAEPAGPTTSRIIPPVWIAPDAEVSGSVVGPYVHLGPGCRVAGSVVGPYVSLEGEARVEGAVVRDVSGATGVAIRDAVVTESLLGAGATIAGTAARYNIGDGSTVHPRGGDP